MGRKTIKEGAALRALRRSIEICKLKNLPMEAKSRKKNASFMKDVERGASKGGREKDGRVLVPRGRRTPDMCPKVTVIGSVDLLEADHVGRVVAEETENILATLRGGHALNVQGQDLKGGETSDAVNRKPESDEESAKETRWGREI